MFAITNSDHVLALIMSANIYSLNFIHRVGFAAEQIARWVQDRTDVQVWNSSGGKVILGIGLNLKIIRLHGSF